MEGDEVEHLGWIVTGYPKPRVMSARLRREHRGLAFDFADWMARNTPDVLTEPPFELEGSAHEFALLARSAGFIGLKVEPLLRKK